MSPGTDGSGPARVELPDGNAIPQVGLGVFQIPPDETADAVAHALRVGYRGVDTAAAYGNEAEVGEAVRASSDAVFVTTKLWNSDHGRDRTLRAFEQSLERGHGPDGDAVRVVIHVVEDGDVDVAELHGP